MGLRLDGADEHADGDRPRAALVLLGYRNDLARHRVATLLRRRGLIDADDPPLPCEVYERGAAETVTALAAELDRLGAVVRVTPLDQAPPAAAPPPDAPATEPQAAGDAPSAAAGAVARRFALPPLNYRLLFVVAIGAVAIFRALRPAPELVVAYTPPPAASRPAAGRPPTRAAEPAAERRMAAARVKQFLAAGDLAAAEQTLARLADHGDDATTQALRGALHGARGDWQSARGAYERAVALDSEDPAVFLALSGLYRQQGRQDDAVDMLHRAQQHGARGPEFEAIKQLVISEQAAESDFASATSPHFTVSFAGGRDDRAAQLVLRQLEHAYLVVGHKLGSYPDHLTPVVLYSAEDFQRVTHAPGWAGALYDGRIKVPVGGVDGDSPELARTVRHEYAHALVVAMSGGRCPVWLNEGVAMWAEEDRDGEREAWALGAVQLARPLGLAELERSFAHLSAERALAAYAQSYLAVRHLVARYGERALQQLLIAFATAGSTADAFRVALPIELTSFEDDLRRELGS